MRILITLAVLVAALMAYIRFAPTDTATWHQMPDTAAPGDTTEAGSFLAVRRITAPSDQVLAAAEQRALATPRTTLVAGNVQEGMITFQTRSLFWGFPDHTTVGVKDDHLVIYGRLRFGRSDLGVNKARIESWLETLGPLTEPL
ncbi:DUF1499 domain-containing protein [Yoonia sp. GPGPB17]|uniref:DUF1499 domain-containing protein n=1 Tax=Yoonia sp. GPGPB17 TaxID=3026147 RepID=UPI0030BDC39D